MIVVAFILVLISLFQLHRCLEPYSELERELGNAEIEELKNLKIKIMIWGLVALLSIIAFVANLLDLIE